MWSSITCAELAAEKQKAPGAWTRSPQRLTPSRSSCARVAPGASDPLHLPTKASFSFTDGTYPWPIRSIRRHFRTWRCFHHPVRVPEGTRNLRSGPATVPPRSNPATRRQPFHPGAPSLNSWPARAWSRAQRTFLQNQAEACFTDSILRERKTLPERPPPA